MVTLTPLKLMRQLISMMLVGDVPVYFTVNVFRDGHWLARPCLFFLALLTDWVLAVLLVNSNKYSLELLCYGKLLVTLSQ